jgi:integrase
MVCPDCGAKSGDKECAQCEVPTKYAGRLFHDLRRSAVKNLTAAGVSQAVAMRISGHKTASMFQRYNIVCTDDLKIALEKTQKFRKREAAKQKVVKMRRS